MRYIKNTILLFAILCNIPSFAQNEYTAYDWEENPVLLEVPSKEKEEAEIILKEATVIAFDFTPNNNLEEFFINHSIVHINSDDAIEANNKIYLPLPQMVDVIKQRARVISPDGKVIEMKKSDIKEAKKGKNTFRYFALRGVEKGSQVESFFMLRKKRPQYEGRMIAVQSDIPKYNVSFDIYAPQNLVFSSKCYNGLAQLELIEEDDDNNFHLSQTWDHIEALKPEESSFYSPNLKKVIYKIDKNKLNPIAELISYDIIAKSFYEEIEITPKKSLAKKFKKFIKEIGINKIKDDRQKLIAFENHMKKNYPILQSYNKELENLEDIIKSKTANERGIVKFYCAVLNYLDIDHQLVLTNDRTEHKFDESFQSYSFLNNYMIYFPQWDKYLAPSEQFSKLGIVPQQWTNNFGLFIKPEVIGPLKYGSASVKFINPLKYDESKDDMIVDIRTEDNFKNLSINYKKKATGYYAQAVQPYYDFLDENQMKELNESQIKFLTEDLTINEMEVTNASLEDFGVAPYQFESQFTTNAFLQKAGDKILFKIGDLIGPQMEMYQETTRKLPVENGFNRYYHRELSLTVPNNFNVSNLEALNISELFKEDGKMQAQFVSKYTFENNVVNVLIDEYYDKIEWPVDQFEEYRRVINAAADFNKVVLYLEKK